MWRFGHNTPVPGADASTYLTLDEITYGGFMKRFSLQFASILFLLTLALTPARSQVGGSGTANYVPLWTNSTTLGNSKIFQSGLYVVINDGLAVQQNSASPNIIAGFHGNSIGRGVVAATLSGGGAAGGVNTITANFGTIGGGDTNTASGGDSTISGGSANNASGIYATVPGGYFNLAQGRASLAAGTAAQALSDGTFVWGDDSSTNAVTDTGTNSFVARASGGVTFYSDSTLASGVSLAPGSGSWSSLSDRDAKDNFAAVDGHAVLAALANMPVFTWNYKTQSPTIRHIGPVAQDFYAALGLGEDDKHISTVDADGVALAAVQALDRVVQEKEQRIEELERRISQLERTMGK
jgi:hypothetical protein